MKVEKKLEIFSQLILMAVEEKRFQITQEVNDSFNNAVDEATRAMEKQAQERIRTERYKIEKNKNKEIVAASASAKRTLISMRENLTNELFADVIADIKAFTGTPEYDEHIVSTIKSLSAGSRYAYVELMRRDMRLAERINAETGLTVEASGDDFIGGFRLITGDRRAVSDHTLLTRIQEERRNFSMRAV